MTNHAQNGRAREHRLSAYMQDRGWMQVMRAAGSKGPADLAMAHPEHGLALVQVGGAGKTLGPHDRARLIYAAQLCSALPILAVCAPRVPPKLWVVNVGTPATWEEWAA